MARSGGNPYGILTLEDFTGQIDVMVLDKAYTEFGPIVQPDGIAVVRARVRTRDDGISLTANLIAAR